MLKKIISSNHMTLYSTSFVVVVVLIAALVLDTSLVRISALFIHTQQISTLMIEAFVAIGIIYAIGQYVLLKIVKLKGKEPSDVPDSHMLFIHKLVSIVQYILAVIIICVILQILATAYYSTILVILATSISYTLAIALMGLLTQRFISWFKSNRNYVVLLYGLSCITL